MPRAASLPETLRYLQPFRKKLATIPAGELDEELRVTLLFELFTKRISGCSSIEAEARITHDFEILRGWLSAPSQIHDHLQCVIGIFSIYSPAQVVKHLQEEAAKPPAPVICLKMDLPPRAKLSKRAGKEKDGMLVYWKTFSFAVCAMPEEANTNMSRALGEMRHNSTVAISDVIFGPVSGGKFVRVVDTWRGPIKQVDYLLKVPGGRAVIRMSSKSDDGPNWDESEVEAYFHTINIKTEPV